MAYSSLGRLSRFILEKNPQRAPELEKDMNDQVAVGTYHTKAFEMSPKAQKLYSNLPKDAPATAAESAAIELDRLFDLFRATQAQGYTNASGLSAAAASVVKIEKLASVLGLENEHNEIVNDILRQLNDYEQHTPDRIIAPDDHVHPLDDKRFNTDPKKYSTDHKNDRDIVNVKNYLIRRGIKVQRKLKIIDTD